MSTEKNPQYDALKSRGDGVFTTMRIKDSKVLFLKDHIQRLLQSASFLYGGAATIDLETSILKMLNQFPPAQQSKVRINVYPESEKVLTVNKLLIDLWSEPIDFVEFDPLLSVPRKIKTVPGHGDYRLPNFIKSNQYLMTQKYLREARALGFEEILYVDREEQILEAGFGNVFFISGSQILTPSLRSGILDGITRKRLLHYLKGSSFEVWEDILTLRRLKNIEGMFLASSVKGLVPICNWGEKSLNTINLPIFSKIVEGFNHYRGKYLTKL